MGKKKYSGRMLEASEEVEYEKGDAVPWILRPTALYQVLILNLHLRQDKGGRVLV
jgi:hypothetical protein